MKNITYDFNLLHFILFFQKKIYKNMYDFEEVTLVLPIKSVIDR